MKTFVKYLVGTAALVVSMGAMGQNEGYATQDLPVGAANNVLGHILCTAAINTNGTRAGGASVLSSAQLAGLPGQYQVIFKPPCQNITARNGWARIVQVDTLTTGAITDVGCTTADRAGNVNAVFVFCHNGAGVATNTSFFLYVLR
jgi:hypothetical protein